MKVFESIAFPPFIIELIITICNAPARVLAMGELHKGMLKGMELKTAAYQVSLQHYWN